MSNELMDAKKTASAQKSVVAEQLKNVDANKDEMSEMYNNAMLAMQRELVLQGKVQQES